MSSSNQKPITPNPPRWKPSPDPAKIVIPGLDTEASTSDQIEQIEQLITIKLQNIDENFSKIHNVLANKILPAVKRYAVGTEPVREAAKFWTSFYEQAAQIRIPTYDDDYSTVNEVSSERDEDASSHEQTADEFGDRTEQHHEAYESTVNSETSFLPGQGAFSSTPATARKVSAQDSFASMGIEDPSWTQSMESPFGRLSREVKNLALHPDENARPSTSSTFDSIMEEEDPSDVTFETDTITIPRSAKGKGKDTSHPLLKNVLRHNLYSASDNSSFELKATSPLKFRGKPKTPVIDKRSNPYLPNNSSSVDWSGVVDLRDQSVLTPQRHRSGKATAKKTTTPGVRQDDDDDDDSFDALPPGMSPLALISPARPPRSAAEVGMFRLEQTPVKEASERIRRDLLKSALKSAGRPTTAKSQGFYKGGGGGAFESSSTSMSTVPTPPSLSRYARPGNYSTASSSSSMMMKDPSLESMIRHIRTDIGGDSSSPSISALSTTPGLHVKSRAAQQQQKRISTSRAGPAQQPQPKKNSDARRLSKPAPPALDPATPVYEPLQHQHQDLDMDSDLDSLDEDEINTTSHPSAAFLMASQGAVVYDDDSFGSSNHSSDSLENEDVGLGGLGIVPVHPFAQQQVFEDDGFDDDDDDSSDGFEVGGLGLGGGVAGDGFEEETVFGLAPAQRHGGRPSDGQHLRMLGEDLLQDTIGIGAQIAANGRVEDSPTPAGWGR